MTLQETSPTFPYCFLSSYLSMYFQNALLVKITAFDFWLTTGWGPESSWSLFQSYIHLKGASSFLHYGQRDFFKITLKEVVRGNSALPVLNFRHQFGPLSSKNIMFLFEYYKFYHGTYFKEMSFSSLKQISTQVNTSLETIPAVSAEFSTVLNWPGAVEDVTSYT